MSVFLKILRGLRRAGKDLAVAWYAFHHPSTPLIGKFLLLVIALYLLSPVDLIPDTFPLLGWVDDFALASLALPKLLNCLPGEVLHESRQHADSLWKRIFLSDKN